MLNLLKPCQQKRRKREWISFPDGVGGREVIDTTMPQGKLEYHRRTTSMWEDQGFTCALQIHEFCKRVRGQWLRPYITCDHRNGRTKSRRDDRPYINGKQNNHAVCTFCNTQKGSRPWDVVIKEGK